MSLEGSGTEWLSWWTPRRLAHPARIGGEVGAWLRVACPKSDYCNAVSITPYRGIYGIHNTHRASTRPLGYAATAYEYSYSVVLGPEQYIQRVPERQKKHGTESVLT